MENRKMKTAEDFRKAAAEHRIEWWPIHNCSMCGYQCGYIIRDGLVAYDPGCYCSRSGRIEPRSWDEIADHYNMQSNPDYIKKMDLFWGL